MKEKIIQAIKNFDIAALKKLLEDDKPYQDVNKTLFLEKLETKFNRAKRDDCYSFDDLFFGICGSCNKGCEGITFLSNTGYYLDLYIESKDGIMVEDIYVCNKLTNFTSLEKTMDLGFQFYKDQKVLFNPSSDYIFISDQYQLITNELELIEEAISFKDLLQLIHRFDNLFSELNKLDPLSIFFYELYRKANRLKSDVDKILWLELFKQDAIDGLINYQVAKTEREQLIWFYQNQKNHEKIIYADIPSDWQSDSIATYMIHDKELFIDISGHEFVLDYLQKLQRFHDDIVEKYRPTPEHFKQSRTKGIELSLENHLRLHNMYLDVVEKYGVKKS